MKNSTLKMMTLFLGVSLFFSCKPTNDTPKVEFGYTLEISSTELSNAPALQSFAHAVDGTNWLLFAGRTNTKDPKKGEKDDGGLHNMNANYSSTSFPPPSFNKNIFVYNVATDATQSISVEDLLGIIEKEFPMYLGVLAENISVFQNTNSQVKQSGEFMYLVGGYGPKDILDPTSAYVTYNQVAKIHVPSLVNLVKGDYAAVDKDKLFAFGKHENLIATGGELQTTGSGDNLALYLVGGHCFGNNCYNGQKYQDAAYKFTVASTKGKDSLTALTVSLGEVLSDVSDPKSPAADNDSQMRRRDGPILPQLFKNAPGTDAQQGFAFFAGVFKPGDDPLEAWNDALYFHPGFVNSESKLYTIDSAYDQKNYNVYSCPNFVVYDEKNETVHSFLMGGIGDGKSDPAGNLSGFTNTAMHIETSVVNIKSTNTLISPENLFNKSKENAPNFYGAEAIFFNSSEVTPYVLGKTETELLDMSKFGDSDVFVGYIFGGIEAFVSNPASYGPRKSKASNKIWKVTLKKK
tara:strand:- start:56109 stop:57665 length:1557 start_codon:yes stop_codon:yes gene_type:complete